MAFTINTNIASLQAQNYLRTTNQFQGQTINRVTSGLRIVNSGDDAAGLAIANGYRSNEAVLTQGVRNANDGLSQLQTADGGISNISQLLDRARTLATQSASNAFTGDRGVLNSEFQGVLTEIDRQAQAIGLNQGGQFAKNLSVFIGGGQASNGISEISNGSVALDLSKSTVDAKSLGLEGVQATGKAETDLGTGSTTSVAAILSNASNQASIANNTTDFYFTGPGFSDTSGNNVVKVAVNLTGVTDTNTLVTAINSAIQNAGNGASQQATAFKNANVTASVSTDSSGKQQLAFSSGTTAFQVQGGDQVSTAFLGSFHSGGPQGASALVAVEGNQAFAAPAAANAVNIRILGAGLTGTQGDIHIAQATTDDAASTVSAINTAIAANAKLAATGIQAVNDSGTIDFVGHAGQSFEVQTSGDIANTLGFGAYLNSNLNANNATPGTFDYNDITAGAAIGAAKTQGLAISVNGSAAVDLGVLSGSATLAATLTTVNNAIQGNASLRAAGLQAVANGTKLELTTTSGSSTKFRVELYGGNGDAFGFGASATGYAAGLAASDTGTAAGAYVAKDSVNSTGAQESVNSTKGTVGGNPYDDVYQFTALRNAGDAQTVTLTAVDSSGSQHSLNVALDSTNASTLDQAVGTINSAILASNDTTIKGIAAFKEQGLTGNVNGVEGVRFLSAGASFKVSLGASAASSTGGVVGLADGEDGTNGGAVLTSGLNGTGSTADISNVSTAQAAVAQLATSVSLLGAAQAVVGRGENQFNYAINLASSQLTNEASAEAGIRDADLAAESANLTKASIQLQAGIAALAQANSAPQQVLTLLRG
ncbi:MAG TPA: flagellin [Bryobacteraceae bacterium]